MTASDPTAAAPRPTGPRWLRLLAATCLSLGFALPTLAVLWYRADPLTFANESIAYRYLLSERLLNGEGATVWVLAGFLTTAIQTSWLAIMNLFSEPSVATLPGRIALFGAGFSVLVAGAGAAMFYGAALSRRFTWADLGLLGLVALGPIFGTRIAGFYYSTLPDYYHLNLLLSVAATWILLWQWRAEAGRPTHWAELLGVGLFIGAMCGNKVTMIVIGFPIALFPLLRGPFTWLKFMLQGLIILAGIAAGFALTIAWFYRFNLEATTGILTTWLSTIQNPGSEPDFWKSNFRGFLEQYAYEMVIGFYGLTILIVAALAVRGRKQEPRTLVMAGALLVCGLAWAYFVLKRPAGTTFFEASVALFGLATMAITLVADTAFGRRFLVAALVGWTGWAATTFAWRQNMTTLRTSRPWGQDMWQLHSALLDFAKGRPIAIIHPGNEYTYGGVPEFLIKGAADLVSWTVSSLGQPIVERYSPRTLFRHEHDLGSPHPNAPYPAGTVLFWVNRDDLPRIEDRYSLLKDALNAPDHEKTSWSMRIQDNSRTIQAYAVVLPERSAAMEEIPVTPPAGLQIRVARPGVIEVTRPRADTTTLALQLRLAQDDWFAVGRMGPNVSTYEIPDLVPGGSYTLRARTERAGKVSTWVEWSIPSTTGP